MRWGEEGGGVHILHQEEIWLLVAVASWVNRGDWGTHVEETTARQGSIRDRGTNVEETTARQVSIRDRGTNVEETTARQTSIRIRGDKSQAG